MISLCEPTVGTGRMRALKSPAGLPPSRTSADLPRSSTRYGPNASAPCQLDLSASDESYLACTCPLGGTFDVVVVARPQRALVRRHWWPFNTIELPRDLRYLRYEYLRRGWIACVVLASLTGTYVVLIALAHLFGNESEIRRNARYYDFWREQRKLRIEYLSQKSERFSLRKFCALTKLQLQNQHKVFRIFTMRYDPTLQDASAAPTAKQKISVLYTILTIKLMVAAALFDPMKAQTYAAEALHKPSQATPRHTKPNPT